MTALSRKSKLLLASSALVTISMLAGCGGLHAHNEKGEGYVEEPEYDEGPEYQVVSDEDCATACIAAVENMSDLLEGEDACTFECDVDIGTSFDGSVDLSVLLALVEVEVDGEVQSGGACEMILNCGTGCQAMAQVCISANPGNPEFVDGCMEEYRECRIDEVCEATQLECIYSADTFLTTCLSQGGTADDCWDSYNVLIAECTCIYGECVDGGDPTDCVDAQPASLPYSPSPGRWLVPQTFFDVATDRLGGVGREVFLMPRLGPNGLFGIELGSIVEGDTLSSLGLQNGDIFRGIDGHTAADLLDQPALAISALSDGQFDVLIHRGDQSRMVEYRVVD